MKRILLKGKKLNVEFFKGTSFFHIKTKGLSVADLYMVGQCLVSESYRLAKQRKADEMAKKPAKKKTKKTTKK